MSTPSLPEKYDPDAEKQSQFPILFLCRRLKIVHSPRPFYLFSLPYRARARRARGRVRRSQPRRGGCRGLRYVITSLYLRSSSNVCAEDDSPYPEVRSAVANTDDPDMPCNTLRAWVMGLAWTILTAGLNQFFFFRYPSVNVGSVGIPSPCQVFR